ncbi:MAG: glucosaminidase domain-containing protein [Gammaproteobacteria bacterium]|nr:glucosaminidase domain-containing protein [Gammaproteobacteria bacterium]
MVRNLTVFEKQIIPETTLEEPSHIFPDFSIFADVETKKRSFFDYTQGFIVAEINSILALRAELAMIADSVDQVAVLNPENEKKLIAVAIEYRVDYEGLSKKETLEELMLRVDFIPASLVLAQAANESAWGVSRFAVEGNNIFGQWCYEKGCGIVPARREAGAKHEVKIFDTVQSSIKAYFLNINTHDSYSYLRDLRAKMRDRGLKLDPMSLAIGLGRYSERGDSYVDEIQRIIIQNDLRKRDT